MYYLYLMLSSDSGGEKVENNAKRVSLSFFKNYGLCEIKLEIKDVPFK